MKRLLQLVSAVLCVLAVALVWRIAQVMQVEPPAFPQTVQGGKAEPVAPPVKRPTPSGAAIGGILAGNLFETERGQKPPEDTGVAESAPLPPPTNVSLSGVFVREGEPMAIVTDSSSGNRQMTLRVGENVGDYRVGEILSDRVTLLGSGGQRFLLELDIKKGGGAVRTPVRPTPAATPAGRTPAQLRAAAARNSRAAPPRASAVPVRPPARTSAAARAAAARARAAQNRTAPARAGKPAATAAQSRLEALRQLRQAGAAR